MQFNLADLWERVADTVPDNEALVHGRRRFTFQQTDERATRLAHVLAARGIDPDRREDLVLRGVTVGEVMSPAPPVVRADAPLDVVLARFLESDLDAVFVTDPGGRLLGQVAIHDVKEGIGEQASLGALVVARDVCESAATAQDRARCVPALARVPQVKASSHQSPRTHRSTAWAAAVSNRSPSCQPIRVKSARIPASSRTSGAPAISSA